MRIQALLAISVSLAGCAGGLPAVRDRAASAPAATPAAGLGALPEAPGARTPEEPAGSAVLPKIAPVLPTAAPVLPPPAPVKPRTPLPPARELAAILDAALARYALPEFGPHSARSQRVRRRLEALVSSPEAARILEARALERVGDRAGALARWERLVSDRAGGAEALTEYARLAVRSGSAEEALAVLAAGLDQAPRDPDLGGVLGWLLLQTGNPIRARGNLENTWGTARAGRFAVYLGRVRLVAGDLAGAAEAAELAVGQPAASAAAWVLLGEVRRAKGLTASAAEAYRKALELSPRDYAALVDFGLLRLGEGNPGEAAELFSQAAEAAAIAPEAWNDLGLVRRARGDYAGAKQAFEKALAAAPAFGPALKNLGILNEKYRARPAEGLPLYDRYLKVRPGDPEVERWKKAATRMTEKAQP